MWWLGTPVVNLAEGFVDRVFRDMVDSPQVGSVVYCDLAAGYGDHSGIYIGNNQIVHLDGSGNIEVVTPTQFVNRLGGFNTAMSIYVSCNETTPVGSYLVSDRARIQIGKERDYSLLLDNCHQFTSGCLHGDFDNSHNFLWMLKDEVKTHLNGNSWRIWDTELFD